MDVLFDYISSILDPLFDGTHDEEMSEVLLSMIPVIQCKHLANVDIKKS